MVDKIRQLRGSFDPPISQKVSGWFYFALFVFVTPAVLLGILFCDRTSSSSDKWVLLVLAFFAIALGLLLFLKTGVKYDFSTTSITVKNQIGFAIKTIGYHEMISATTQADHGMTFLIITSQRGSLRIQLYKTMIDIIGGG